MEYLSPRTIAKMGKTSGKSEGKNENGKVGAGANSWSTTNYGTKTNFQSNFHQKQDINKNGESKANFGKEVLEQKDNNSCSIQ